jgi:hypothetical protein
MQGFGAGLQAYARNKMMADEARRQQMMAPLQRALMQAQTENLQADTKSIGAETPIGPLPKYTPDQLKNATILRKEFDDSPITGNYQALDASARQLDAVYEQGKTATSRIASDQALGVIFQKMLDPTSVVRESEYARTPEGAAALNRIKAVIPQFMKGGLAITDEDREAIVDTARVLFNEAKKAYIPHFKRYESLAPNYGTDPELIFSGYTLPKLAESSKPKEPIVDPKRKELDAINRELEILETLEKAEKARSTIRKRFPKG